MHILYNIAYRSAYYVQSKFDMQASSDISTYNSIKEMDMVKRHTILHQDRYLIQTGVHLLVS